MQLFGAFVDGSGEKATPFKLYGMAGQRKIVLKDIQLKRFLNKSFPPFALTEADYVAFDFDIFMPGDTSKLSDLGRIEYVKAAALLEIARNMK
ncbi:hypothetical protein [Weissella confusa]